MYYRRLETNRFAKEQHNKNQAATAAARLKRIRETRWERKN